ncbi:hypothetical protein GCM10022223_23130 [Kineosporia mesophila]|uniref:Uncharacterized protein n=1 Tax=Kineosporia mesophila TaxID=566012 RepID=A0ABP6ZE06_9ACTN|nr:hypothetical protein [Kineosporia mesophila]
MLSDDSLIENADRLGREVFGPELTARATSSSFMGEVRGAGAFWP